MDFQLKNKIVFLAGGAGSIGQAMHAAFEREGAKVVLADQGETLTGHQLSGMSLNVTDQQSVTSAIDQVYQEHGRIDVLIVLAGIYQGGPVEGISSEQWRRVLDVNLQGTFLVTKECLPRMAQQDFGRILCLASLAGQVGGVVAGANYSASKAGVLSLVKSLAKQCPAETMTINAISPGPVAGAMTDSWTEEERQSVCDKIPIGRFTNPDEIADLALFLSSPSAAAIHGARLDINGGLYMD